MKKREINDIETVDELAIAVSTPAFFGGVYINEDCFIHTPSDSQNVTKQIINQHPDTLFIVLWQLLMCILMNIYQ